MGSILRFARQELLAVFLVVGGVAVFVYNAVSGVLQLRNWGIPTWGWQTISALLMGLGLLVVAYRLHQRVEAAEAQAKPASPAATKIVNTPTLKPVSMTKPPSAPPSPGLITSPPPPTARLHNRILDAALPVQLRSEIVRDWGRPGSFELYQAAYLWGDELPPRSYLMPISPRAHANLEMLKGAVIDGEIARAAGPRNAMENLAGAGFVDEQTRVTRQDLLAFATTRGDYPLFLFPDGSATGLV